MGETMPYRSEPSRSPASVSFPFEVETMEQEANHQSDLRGQEDRPLIRSLSRNSRNLAIEESESNGEEKNPNRVLNTLFGVFIPVALSQFSTTVFLRLGFVVGQSGLLLSLVQFLLAYAILGLTVLSICAISTNGAIEGGGAYYMISRALGPEFGGSIGLLFFLANIFSCAVYVSGFVEGVTDSWGSLGGLAEGRPIPIGRWYAYAYGSCVLLLCLLICMIGAKMFARTSSVILSVVVICIGSVLVSMWARSNPIHVHIPCANKKFYGNLSGQCGHLYEGNDTEYEKNNTIFYKDALYTGINLTTMKDNLYEHYTKDYTNPDKPKMTFFVVFAILFSGVTGIMNGANMSGELRSPEKSIPRGTLLAVMFTFIVYIFLTIFVASSSSRKLLHEDYNFLQDINLWPPFVYIGIFAATLSAALGNLIGASRVLEALAKDDLFWIFTRPARFAYKGNPIGAVLISWLLVQAVLLIGSMNAIAPMTTVFFLLSYAAVNIACLALQLASAPNFRPTFKYFTWYTCTLAFFGCLTMTFLINPIYASIGIVIMAILVIALYFRAFTTSWGSISQALIFHQVRKYLLMLDSRKDHVKFWRPQMLLMVANPRQSSNIIDFVNDLKKSGLFILGHVKVGQLDTCGKDPALTEQQNWLSLVDYLKVKAFVEVTLANSVREGLQQLVRLSGLGGMKPNTVCLGFYDDHTPRDTFQIGKRKKKWGFGAIETAESNTAVNYFRTVRSSWDERAVTPNEYVHMIRDCIKMNKNVCLFRHFYDLDKEQVFARKTHIDVWPMNFYQPDNAAYMDNCCLFLLQLACVLNMVAGWKKHTSLRVFMCHSGTESETELKKKKLAVILHQLRINAQVVPINWTNVISSSYPTELRHKNLTETPLLPQQYIEDTNELIKSQIENTSVVFMYLPKPPLTLTHSDDYMEQLTQLTQNLPPTVLVHGLNPVTSTTL